MSGIRSEHLDSGGWEILKATLEQKRSISFFLDQEYFESTLADLRAVANMMESPHLTFDGEAHVIRHHAGCDNEISAIAFTICGEVKE